MDLDRARRVARRLLAAGAHGRVGAGERGRRGGDELVRRADERIGQPVAVEVGERDVAADRLPAGERRRRGALREHRALASARGVEERPPGAEVVAVAARARAGVARRPDERERAARGARERQADREVLARGLRGERDGAARPGGESPAGGDVLVDPTGELPLRGRRARGDGDEAAGPAEGPHPEPRAEAVGGVRAVQLRDRRAAHRARGEGRERIGERGAGVAEIRRARHLAGRVRRAEHELRAGRSVDVEHRERAGRLDPGGVSEQLRERRVALLLHRAPSGPRRHPRRRAGRAAPRRRSSPTRSGPPGRASPRAAPAGRRRRRGTRAGRCPRSRRSRSSAPRTRRGWAGTARRLPGCTRPRAPAGPARSRRRRRCSSPSGARRGPGGRRR